MDILDRRIARRLARQLPLADGEDVLDFEIGVSRPFASMPPPLSPALEDHSRIEVAVTPLALYLRVTSRTHRDGAVARVAWDDMATFGPYKAEGRYKRWSLRGALTDGTPVVVSLAGRPRPSMLAVLSRLGVEPGDPGPGFAPA